MKKYDEQKDGQQRKNFFIAGALKKLPLLIIGGIAVLMVAGAIVTYFVLRSSDPTSNTNQDPSTADESPLTPQIAPNVLKTVNEANAAVSGVDDSDPAGKKEAGVAVYQNAIKSAADDREAAALWMKQAEFLSTQNDNQGAIAAALKAQDIGGETLETTTMLALLYELTRDYKNAATYYRKAAVQVVKEAGDKTIYDPEIEAAYFREKADQLEKQ